MQLYQQYHENAVFRSIQVPSKKILAPLAHHSPEKQQKREPTEMVRLRSSTSCESYKPVVNLSNRKKYSINKSVNIHSNIIPADKSFIPSQAKEFSEMVKKKNKLLKIKHRIMSQNDCIPNILEIQESVRKSQVSFMRRMDTKLNADGHANLIANLKRDLHIQSHNYLKEMNAKIRKNRIYMKKEESHNDEEYVTIHYKLPPKECHVAQ